MYDMEKNDGMMSDTFRQPCIEAGMTGWDIVFAITCWNSEMTVQELAIMSAGESFGRASSWMEQSMVEKAQSVMPLNKSSILNPTTYDPEYTTYPKLNSVKGTNVGKGTTGQKLEQVEEASQLKDVDAGGITSKEGLGKVADIGEGGKKLDYLFGKATGNKHNIERSTQMKDELAHIGIHDSSNIIGTETRSYIAKELPGNPKIEYTTTTKESLFMGPGGGVKLETVWDGDRLLTVIIKLGK